MMQLPPRSTLFALCRVHRWLISVLLMSSSSIGFCDDQTTVRVSRTSRGGDVKWYDAREIGVEGKAWEETESFFDRLPARAKDLVRSPVWSLSHDSAGMCVRFVTDADAIYAHWQLRSDNLAMPHMPATGVSGVDLYVQHEGRWRWLATGQPEKVDNTACLVQELPPGQREYLLYLPLYNGVTSVELGIPRNASLWQKRFDNDCLPIVFWGTSITQGACASRPGMCHTAILGRWLDRPIINLGFSGNGKMEPEVAKLVSEIDAAVYVIDCLPNLTAELVSQRTRPLVEIIRANREQTPILLVEDRTYGNAFLLDTPKRRNDTSRTALRAAFEAMRRDGISALYYLSGERLLGQDGEDTVDSSHPTDLGFVRQAQAFDAVLRPILGATSPPERWWKGNLHTHSLWSDGNDFPEMIADWYRNHGYHFLALSDHNVLSQGMKWKALIEIERRNGKTALPKYLARFGEDWVETRGSREEETFEVRLKPFDEVRSLMEASGQFLMIPSEEITDAGAHINATNIAELIEPQGGDSVRQTIENNLRAVEQQAQRLGRTIVPHLNHPNLGDTGISAEELAALIQDEFFEVFNGVEGDGDLGSARRHGLETLWDITSTLRIHQYHAPPMFGLATDDSHHYHGVTNASPGRGWIMLRAKRLTPESIVNAMKRGDFYASSGVVLRQVEFDESTRTLRIEIEPDGDATFRTQFIGTPVDYDQTTTARIDQATKEPIQGTLDYSQDVGKVLATETGLSVHYRLTGDELYVRATITSDQEPLNPTSESPYQKAWTQPVGWRSRLK